MVAQWRRLWSATTHWHPPPRPRGQAIDARSVYSFLEMMTHRIKKAPVRCEENQKNPMSRASRIACPRLSFHSELCERGPARSESATTQCLNKLKSSMSTADAGDHQ
jgi:hypothetical protein